MGHGTTETHDHFRLHKIWRNLQNQESLVSATVHYNNISMLSTVKIQLTKQPYLLHEVTKPFARILLSHLLQKLHGGHLSRLDHHDELPMK